MLWFISTFLPYLVSSLALLPNYEMKGAAYELRHAPKQKQVFCVTACAWLTWFTLWKRLTFNQTKQVLI